MANTPPMKAALLVAVVALLHGCTTAKTYDSSQYHADRNTELAALQRFEQCRGDALTLNASARTQHSPAQYLSAARTMDVCLTEIEPYSRTVETVELMQLHALSVLAFLKGGEVSRARTQLDGFQYLHPGKDLYLADNTSFVDSVSALLGQIPAGARSGAVLNISPQLSAEMQRRSYWQQH